MSVSVLAMFLRPLKLLKQSLGDSYYLPFVAWLNRDQEVK